MNITFFPGGDSITCVNITINEDQAIENTEGFTIVLERVLPGAITQEVDSSVVRILDTTGKDAFRLNYYIKCDLLVTCIGTGGLGGVEPPKYWTKGTCSPEN